jgi:hypothetical protein
MEMKITKRQLRRIIREQANEDVKMYREKIRMIFPTDAQQAIALADAVGIGGIHEVTAMESLVELMAKFLEEWPKDDASDLAARKRGSLVGVNRHGKVDQIEETMHDLIKDISFASTQEARPIINLFVNASYSYENGPPYKVHTFRDVETLADWAGVAPPELDDGGLKVSR